MFPKAKMEMNSGRPPCCPNGISPLHYAFWFWVIPPCPTPIHIKLSSPCVCNLFLGQCYSIHNKFGHCCASYNIAQEMPIYKKASIHGHSYHDLHINLY
jgi:hypothetical protein